MVILEIYIQRMVSDDTEINGRDVRSSSENCVLQNKTSTISAYTVVILDYYYWPL